MGSLEIGLLMRLLASGPADSGERRFGSPIFNAWRLESVGGTPHCRRRPLMAVPGTREVSRTQAMKGVRGKCFKPPRPQRWTPCSSGATGRYGDFPSSKTDDRPGSFRLVDLALERDSNSVLADISVVPANT
jgi:hypothetical protein